MVNLLCFFVLLFAWSKPADGARFSAGLGGFLFHLESWGLAPDAEGERRREERIREIEGRLRLDAPRRELRSTPREPRSGPLPFAESGLVPGVARFAAGTAELLATAKLDELAHVLRMRPHWRLRLELALPADPDDAARDLAERRLAAARLHLVTSGLDGTRIACARISSDDGTAPERLDLRLLADLSER
jgi:hypothetical protein